MARMWKNLPILVFSLLFGFSSAFPGPALPHQTWGSFQSFLSTTADIPCDDTPTPLPQSEYDALGTIYNQLGGPNWVNRTNWGDASKPANTWYGVKCSSGHITELQFNENNLNGSLPGTALAALTNLEVLVFYNERTLTGNIPSELGSLTHLRELSFGNDALSGPIPGSLANLANLETLHFGEGGITGEVPQWINSLTKLTLLSFYHNRMSGPLPIELCDMTSLTTLRIMGIGGMGGPMPACLGNLTNLQYLDLSGINLTGPISDTIGNLTNLITLDLEQNYLEGPIPESITNLTHLVRFDPVMWAICETNLNYNMLTASSTVNAFLYNIDHNWADTQTVPPGNVQAVSQTPNSVTLSWAPVGSGHAPGNYQVYYASDSGGPWLAAGETANKTQTSMLVENLLSDAPYYFKLRTFTPPFFPPEQQPWISQYSAPVSTTTMSGGLQVVIDPADIAPKTLVYHDPDGPTTTITVPVGAVTQTVTLSYVPITTYLGFNFTEQVFSLTAFQDNLPLSGFRFLQPVTMQVGYTHAELGAIPEDKLVIMIYNAANKSWTDASQTCTPAATYERNLDENWVKVDVCHLTRFALSDPKPYRISLPILYK